MIAMEESPNVDVILATARISPFSGREDIQSWRTVPWP